MEECIEEDDCILIGPGMERGEETRKIVNELLSKYPDKKWVVDGGALQEVDPKFLTSTMIVTPNKREQEILQGKTPAGVTVLAKGVVDIVSCEEIRERRDIGRECWDEGRDWGRSGWHRGWVICQVAGNGELCGRKSGE